MTTINLRTLKKGDTVIFRNGGKAIVIFSDGHKDYGLIKVSLEGTSFDRYWAPTGYYNKYGKGCNEDGKVEDMLDIVDVKKKAFNFLEDVERGMLFIHQHLYKDCQWLYVAPCLENPETQSVFKVKKTNAYKADTFALFENSQVIKVDYKDYE